MIDVKALKAEVVRNGYTQEKLAKEIGMSARTFSNRLKKGVFGSDEIELMITILNIKEPIPIFFTSFVT